MDRETLMRAAELQKQSEEAERNLQFIDEQIQELDDFRKSLIALNENDSEEMLASLGKGVYVKTELKEKELFVNVGAGVVVKKNVGETVKVIEQQIKKFSGARIRVRAQLENCVNELGEIIREIEKLKRGN